MRKSEGMPVVTAVEVFELSVECYLRELDDDTFEQLRLRVRPPTHQPYADAGVR